MNSLPGRRSTSEQCCSTHCNVERYKSSRLAVETVLLKDTSNGSHIKLSCTNLVKE